MSTEDLTLPRGEGGARDDTLPQRKGTPSDQLGEKIGRHVVLSVLGSGGMGIVDAAYDPALDRKIVGELVK